jgi:hypothetical protein
MKREDIVRLRQIAFKRFYSRPSYLLKKVLSIRNRHDVKVALRGARSLFWILAGNDVFKRSGGDSGFKREASRGSNT